MDPPHPPLTAPVPSPEQLARVDSFLSHPIDSPPPDLHSPRGGSGGMRPVRPMTARPLVTVWTERVWAVFAHDSEFRSLAMQVVQRSDQANARYVEQALVHLELARDAAAKAVSH
jgi:hypothetical protein